MKRNLVVVISLFSALAGGRALAESQSFIVEHTMLEAYQGSFTLAAGSTISFQGTIDSAPTVNPTSATFNSRRYSIQDLEVHIGGIPMPNLSFSGEAVASTVRGTGPLQDNSDTYSLEFERLTDDASLLLTDSFSVFERQAGGFSPRFPLESTAAADLVAFDLLFTKLHEHEDPWDSFFSTFDFVSEESTSTSFLVESTTFELLEAPSNGDFDMDNDVDGADFLKWQRDDGTPDGLALWQSNYGNTPPLSSASIIVPEPAALTLLALGCCSLLFRTRVCFS